MQSVIGANQCPAGQPNSWYSYFRRRIDAFHLTEFWLKILAVSPGKITVKCSVV